MSLPLAAILLLLIFAAIRFKYNLAVLTVFIFSVSSILIHFLRPSFDDQHFILAALQYNTMTDVLSDTAVAISPVSPLISLIFRILGVEVRTAVLLLNSVLTSATLMTATHIFKPRRQAKTRIDILIPFALLMACFPSTGIVLITANKDLCIVFCLICFFSAILAPIERPISYLTSISKVLQISLSLFVLVHLRQYFGWYLALAYFMTFELRLLRKLRFDRFLAILTSFVTLHLVLSAIIFAKWSEIRGLVETYYGAATIWPLYSIEAPSTITAITYPLFSLLSIIFYPFGLAFTNPSVSEHNIIIGFYEAASFLGLLAIAIKRCSMHKILIFAPIFFFVLIHFTIQPFGSPNVGSLFRLRLFEIFILIGGTLSLKTKSNFLSQTNLMLYRNTLRKNNNYDNDSRSESVLSQNAIPSI